MRSDPAMETEKKGITGRRKLRACCDICLYYDYDEDAGENVCTQHLDEDELINVESYTLEELKQMIYECRIQDAKTICGIMTYASKYGL